MDRSEYLVNLRSYLYEQKMTESDIEDAMSFYGDMIMDSSEEDFLRLGSVEQLGSQILAEHGIFTGEQGGFQMEPAFMPGENRETNGGQNFADMEAQQRRNKMLIVTVVLAVTFPIWIGILSGGFGLFIGLFCALLALICVPVAVGVGLLISGVPVLFNAPPLGITMIGAAFVLFGLDGLVFIPLLKLLFRGIRKLIELGVNFIKGLFNNRAGVTTV